MLSTSSSLPVILALTAGLGMAGTTAWQAYDFWRFMGDDATVPTTPAIATDQRAEKQTPDIDLASVTLFGEVNQARIAPDQDIDNLPETNLQLVLRGVMSASGDFPGSALIEGSQSRTEAYVVGDELPGNATLRTVRPDRVIIERSGVLENLFFPEQEDQNGVAFASTDSGQGERDFAEQQARPASFASPDPGPENDARREQIRQRLEQLRNRLRDGN